LVGWSIAALNQAGGSTGGLITKPSHEMRATATLVQLIMLLSLMPVAGLPRQVCVTGASGQTGMLVMTKLLGNMKQFDPVIGIVRSKKTAKSLALTLGLQADDLRIADITDGAAIREALAGCTALIICTSAKPQPLPSSPLGKRTFGYPEGVCV
jgi:hypothetical protein